jgi:hypothetical protein
MVQLSSAHSLDKFDERSFIIRVFVHLAADFPCFHFFIGVGRSMRVVRPLAINSLANIVSVCDTSNRSAPPSSYFAFAYPPAVSVHS